jgi:subtilisin family serine protease
MGKLNRYGKFRTINSNKNYSLISGRSGAPISEIPPTGNSEKDYQGFLVSWSNLKNENSRRRALRSLGFDLKKNILSGKEAGASRLIDLIDIKEGNSDENILENLRQHPSVEYVEKNWSIGLLYTSTPNDPDLNKLWGLNGTWGSGASDAWADGLTGSNDAWIGVIDEGIQVNHPDLFANIGTDSFGNNGYDFYNNEPDVSNGALNHGTHVAGTIGGVGNNGEGISGVNWDVSLLSGQFLGPNGGYTSDAIEAVDYFNNQKDGNRNIIATNNSWGGGGFSRGLYDAITRASEKDILFIAAAGNSNTNNLQFPAAYGVDLTVREGRGKRTFYPARENVISVGSITSSGDRSSFSNYGSWVDLGAPGSSIYSTLGGSSYGTYSGTSMASPHVAGAAALLAAAIPSATSQEIKQAILDGGAPTPGTSGGNTLTGDRLWIPGAIDQLEQITGLKAGGGGSDTNLPSITVSNSSSTVVEGGSIQVTLSASEDLSDPLNVIVNWIGDDINLTGKSDIYTIPTDEETTTADEYTFQLIAEDDSIFTGEQTIELGIAPTNNYKVGTPNSFTLTVSENDSPPEPPATDGIVSITGSTILFDELTGRQKYLDLNNESPSYAIANTVSDFDPNTDSLTIQNASIVGDQLDGFNGWFFSSKYSLDGVNGLAVFADFGAPTNLSGKQIDTADDMVAFISGWSYRGKAFLDVPSNVDWLIEAGT